MRALRVARMKKKMLRPLRSLPPPSEAELAAAERTQAVRDRARQEALADEQEQTPIAAAGEPGEPEAWRAGASILNSRPLETPPTPKPRKERAPRREAVARP